MGFFSKMNPFSTEGAISVSAFTFHEAHPELTFQRALERSLIETRPGWDAERIDELERWGRRKKAVSSADWIAVAVDIDKAGRAAATGITYRGVGSGKRL